MGQRVRRARPASPSFRHDAVSASLPHSPGILSRVISAPALSRGDEPAGRRGAVGRTVPGSRIWDKPAMLPSVCRAPGGGPPRAMTRFQLPGRGASKDRGQTEIRASCGRRVLLSGPHRSREQLWEVSRADSRLAVCGCVLTSVGTLAASVPVFLGLPGPRSPCGMGAAVPALSFGWRPRSCALSSFSVCALSGLES